MTFKESLNYDGINEQYFTKLVMDTLTNNVGVL